MITVTAGDCVAYLRARIGPLFDACVCDPPYEIGFMGRAWDKSGVAFQVETWRAIYDQLKPGAHLAAFSGTRTYHRMAVAIEDAGFEIRDQLAWVYGSGFPKSLDVSKAIDKAAGSERAIIGLNPNGRNVEPLRYGGDNARPNLANNPPALTAPATDDARRWKGWGSALKPAWEPICLARKPLDQSTIAANVLAHGTGAINIDACRIASEATVTKINRGIRGGNYGADQVSHGSQETIVNASGRFPANLIHDGSEEVEAGFPDSNLVRLPRAGTGAGGIWAATEGGAPAGVDYGDNGSAARFFYSAKAGPLDRMGTDHPTVKPVDVMRWIERLVTPPGGLILDPFAGSGTTGIAALAEGFDCELIDLNPEHVADIETKLAYLRGEGGRVVERHLKRKAARSTAPAGSLL